MNIGLVTDMRSETVVSFCAQRQTAVKLSHDTCALQDTLRLAILAVTRGAP